MRAHARMRGCMHAPACASVRPRARACMCIAHALPNHTFSTRAHARTWGMHLGPQRTTNPGNPTTNTAGAGGADTCTALTSKERGAARSTRVHAFSRRALLCPAGRAVSRMIHPEKGRGGTQQCGAARWAGLGGRSSGGLSHRAGRGRARIRSVRARLSAMLWGADEDDTMHVAIQQCARPGERT